ncbi:hypothetical protein TcYC6_0037270 [Trypanosoma cruzi]|nr:hypothetical protein TcYC6_0037270 [Trypanosoma cruzi]
MEHVRKYAFGVALIIGEERRHDIVALWVFRGRGVPAIVEDVEDTELFDWERRSPTSRRSGSASRTTCAGRARRSRGLCWRGVCSSERGVLVRDGVERITVIVTVGV